MTNLGSNNLLTHLLSFDPSWEPKLDLLIADEAKDAIDSVVALRHRIAHGQSADITFERIARYYGQVVRVTTGIRELMGLDL